MDDEILIIDEKSLREKIYVVRGVQVMLDFDLAQIYGYTTKAFNQQVKNNIEKFPGDFRFQLTGEEIDFLSRSNFLTSMQTPGIKGGRVYHPYAFTEQGIYMLMTVLRGEKATRQSIALVRTFKEMKDFLIRSGGYSFAVQPDKIENQIAQHSDVIKKMSLKVQKIENNMISKDDLSDFMKLFDSGIRDDEVLILDGQPFKADLAYQKIYGNAKKSVVVIDDYIGIKTLKNLVHAKENVELTIVSDNKGNKPLRLSEYNDFCAEYSGRGMTFLQSVGRTHDRYIVLDEGTRGTKVYHCGASSKDAGKRVTTITRIGDVKEYKALVQELLGNPELILK